MTTPIRILYVDDNPMDRDLVRHALEQEPGVFSLTEAPTREQFGARLEETCYDLVLSDFNILGFEGLEVIDVVRAKCPRVPVIIVTGTGSEEVAVEAMKRGAADYVIKNIGHIRRLPFTIRSVVEKERTAAEHELLQEERDRLFNLAIDPLCVAGFDGSFKQANPAWSRTLGWTEKELLGRPWIEFVHPDDREATIAATEQLVRGQPVYGFENRYLCEDGAYRWLSWNSFPFMEQRQILAVARDMTELRQHQMALAESERKFRLIFENAPLGIFHFDAKGVITACNNVSVSIIGSSMESLVGFDMPVRLTNEGIKAAVQEALSGRLGVYEGAYLSVTGERLTQVRCLFTPLMSEDGPFAGGIGLVEDITKRKMDEEDLQEAARQWQSTFDAVQQVVWLLDSDMRIVRANKTTESIFELDREKIVGQHCWEVVHGTSEPIEQCPVVLAAKSLRREKAELLLGGRWLEIVADPVFDDVGRLIGFVHLVTDITDRKKSAELLRQSEETHRSLIEHLPQRIFLKDRNSVYLSCNANYAADLGIVPEQIVGKDDFAFHNAELAQLYRADDHACMATGTVKDLEEPYQLAGQDRWAHTIKVPYRDEQGRVIGVLGIFEDITDRKMSGEVIRIRLALLEYSATHSLDQLLQKTLDDVGLLTKSPIGFYHFISEDEKTIALQAWSTRTVKEFCQAEGKGRHYPVDQGGVWVDAVRERRPVIHNDYATLSHRKGMPEGHAPVIRELVVPIMRSDRIVAVLGIGNKPTDYTDKDVGVVSHLADVAWEITERKRAQLASLASETRYRRLFEAAKDGILILDAETGQIVDVNPFLTDLLGYSREEMLEKKLWEIGIFEDIAKSQAVFAELQSKQYVRYEDLSLQTIGGEVINVEFVSNVYLVNDAKVIQCNIRDITERRRAELALRESDEKYRTLFEDSIDALFMVMADGTISDVNQAFLDLFGYEKEEIVGHSVLNTYADPADRQRYLQAFGDKGFVRDYPLRLVRKDGRQLDCLLSSRIELDKDGNALGYRGFIRDITEQTNLQKQLLQAQKMEAIGTLAGGVAHDFNNILQVALGYSELILGYEDLPARYRADLQKINDSSRRGADLVQRLLTFSRKTEIKPQPLSLNRRINEMQKMIERTIPKMIDMQLRLADDLATINADPTQVDQVLMNLAVNSRDAMPDGGRLIVETANIILDEEYAKMHLDANPGRYVLLMVTDTGAGMDEETLEHIFEPFYTTKAVGEGTGLGLAMVHGIVRQHGGHIRCYSEAGQGTTFKIYFPALVSEEELQETVTRTMPKGGSETILLVDDEAMIRDLCSRILTKAGYRVITASDGKVALKEYQERSDEISLVILDLIMPEMGGKQCLEGLLSLDPTVKVVIASGYSANGPTKEALAAGAKGFVNKPYDIRQVLEVVRNVLDAE